MLNGDKSSVNSIKKNIYIKSFKTFLMTFKVVHDNQMCKNRYSSVEITAKYSKNLATNTSEKVTTLRYSLRQETHYFVSHLP